MGPPPTDSPARHPGGERHHRNLHSYLTASHHSLLPQHDECHGPTSGLFCQALLQGHILAIPDPDAPTVLFPLLTPPSSAGPTNAQQQAIRIQVILSMGQDRLSK